MSESKAELRVARWASFLSQSTGSPGKFANLWSRVGLREVERRKEGQSGCCTAVKGNRVRAKGSKLPSAIILAVHSTPTSPLFGFLLSRG